MQDQVHKIRAVRTGFVRAGIAFLAISLISSLAVSSALASTAAHKKKHLSLSSVTIVGGNSSGIYALWVAQAQGFFAKQGVTVTWLATNGGGSITTTALLAGAGQFGIDSPASELNAAQQGAPIRGLAMVEQGT